MLRTHEKNGSYKRIKSAFDLVKAPISDLPSNIRTMIQDYTIFLQMVQKVFFHIPNEL